ncbi:MAG: nitroreductase family protein [Candidatus Caldarchaeum sp.]|nr:nitroreductase family protein [Candidatus Caldarchaeum sp.]
MKRKVEQSVLGLLSSRRSIRRFRQSSINEDVLRLIIETGQSAPAYFQAYAVIWLKSEKLVETAFEICGTEAIKQAAAVLLVCIDFNKLETFVESVVDDHFLKLDTYPAEVLLSVFEAGLVVENMVIASEALGYGTLLLDCGIYECERFSEVLKLPNGVIPLTVLLIGEKDETPPPRPRWDLETVLHVDGYKQITKADAQRYLEMADKTLAGEGYLLKYANFRGSYGEYLAERFRANKDLRQSYNALSSFLRKQGLRL